MNSKQWLKTLVAPILVVGNSVLQSPIPDTEYASVVRMNNYVLGGHSGSRVTHWVVNAYQNIESRPVLPALVPWSLRCQQKRGNPGDVFLRRVGADNIIYLINDRHVQWWFPSSVIRGKCFPTTGFCFLAWLHFHSIRPDIAGFDGMKSGHQGDPTFQHGHLKTRDREWFLIRKWGLRRR